MTVADNYRAVCDKIIETALRCGRKAQDVELIAVTKFVDTERIEQAVIAGAGSVGENRVQEYLQKADFFRSRKLNADIIGRLQTNKVKYIVGDVRYIQSVDRLSLAEEINRLALKKNVVQDVLVEVNIGEEAQKGGISTLELKDFLYEVSAMQGVCVKGLMCIPPASDESEAQAYFARMRRLFEDVADEKIEGVHMQELSMGMSGDYMAAIKEGATMVRVGSAIFGTRY